MIDEVRDKACAIIQAHCDSTHCDSCPLEGRHWNSPEHQCGLFKCADWTDSKDILGALVIICSEELYNA